MDSFNESVPMDMDEAADHTIDSVRETTLKVFEALLPCFDANGKAWITEKRKQFEIAMEYLEDHYQRRKPKNPKLSSEDQIKKV